MAMGPGLRPVFKTRDKEWNIAAAKHFEQHAGAAMTFDLGGRYNFFSAQQALVRTQLKDGDVFAVLSKTEVLGTAPFAFSRGIRLATPLPQPPPRLHAMPVSMPS